MTKKYLVFGIVLILVISLSGCPDKNKSQKQDETEKVPNTLEKASSELEQIITLLGGPMFDSRDKIEQLKNEQMQMLSNQASEKPEKSSLGTDMSGQAQEDTEINSNKQNQGGEKGQGGEQGKGEEKEQDGKQAKEEEKGQGGEQGKEEDKGQGGEQAKEEEKGQDGEQGKGEDKGQDGEQGKEEDKGQSGEQEGKEEKQEDGEKKKSSDEEGNQQENTGGQMDMEKPSAPITQEKPFQFEDSLFGIAQWKEENWKMIKVLADSLYFSWNRSQPQLMEKGVSQVQMGNFTNDLESLSKSVQNKDLNGAQISVIGLSQALADFYSYYKTKLPPEIQRITSNVTGIHFSARQSDWAKAQELSNQMQQEFTKLKSSVEDNQNELIKMLELSLTDLSSSVQKQDITLVMLRTNLVMANLQELNAKLSEDSQDSKQ